MVESTLYFDSVWEGGKEGRQYSIAAVSTRTIDERSGRQAVSVFLSLSSRNHIHCFALRLAVVISQIELDEAQRAKRA